MTREENIIERIRNLLLTEYNEMIDADNRERNDGDEIGKLTDVFIESGTGRLPYARLSVKGGEHTEKDRILKNVVYEISVRIVAQETRESWRSKARYRELLEKLIEAQRRDEAWESARMGIFRGDESIIRVKG